tara:strand:+ start:4471 stop:4746 length:276 start_codon:yes stop_codon:yes gene_type:complete
VLVVAAAKSRSAVSRKVFFLLVWQAGALRRRGGYGAWAWGAVLAECARLVVCALGVRSADKRAARRTWTRGGRRQQAARTRGAGAPNNVSD